MSQSIGKRYQWRIQDFLEFTKKWNKKKLNGKLRIFLWPVNFLLSLIMLTKLQLHLEKIFFAYNLVFVDYQDCRPRPVGLVIECEPSSWINRRKRSFFFVIVNQLRNLTQLDPDLGSEINMNILNSLAIGAISGNNSTEKRWPAKNSWMLAGVVCFLKLLFFLSPVTCDFAMSLHF